MTGDCLRRRKWSVSNARPLIDSLRLSGEDGLVASMCGIAMDLHTLRQYADRHARPPVSHNVSDAHRTDWVYLLGGRPRSSRWRAG